MTPANVVLPEVVPMVRAWLFRLTVNAGGGEIDTTTSGQTMTIGTGNIANSSGLTTFGGAGNTTVTSVIGGGSGGVTKTGAGTLTLSNATGNTYTGTTSVNAGTLLITNTSNSATGTGALSVAAGATLAGTGTSAGSSFGINGALGNNATVLVGQTSTADASYNSMTLTGSGASTISNANLTFNLNTANVGQSSVLNVGTTAITFGSGTAGTNPVTLTLNLEGNTAVPVGSSYDILIAGTGGNGTALGSQYSGLTYGFSIAVAGGTLTQITGGNLTLALNTTSYSYGPGSAGYYGGQAGLFLFTGSGIDDIVVVPEPSTWALMLGGLAVLIFWQRRKNKLN